MTRLLQSSNQNIGTGSYKKGSFSLLGAVDLEGPVHAGGGEELGVAPEPHAGGHRGVLAQHLGAGGQVRGWAGGQMSIP